MWSIGRRAIDGLRMLAGGQRFTAISSIWNRYGNGMESVLLVKESGLNR